MRPPFFLQNFLSPVRAPPPRAPTLSCGLESRFEIRVPEAP